MKPFFTTTISLIFFVSSFAQTTFCDDFESYQVGDYLAQNSADWETWASIMAPCPTTPCADDAMISNVQALSGSNSLYLTDATGSGGPQDILLPFGAGIPHVNGDIEVVVNLFVTGSAYMNIQALPTVGATPLGIWALNMTIDATGTITVDGGSTPLSAGPIISSFPLNQWAEFKLNIDLTQNLWEVFINNQSIGSFSNTNNQVSSLNLYPTAGNDFYVDDVCFTYTPFTPLTYDMTAVNLNTASNLALSSAPVTISGDIVNLGSSTINTLDINYSVNGGLPVVDNISGLNLALFDTLNFNHSLAWTPSATGSYLIEIWASNLNGNVDLDSTNDIFSDTIHIWNNIAVRRPLIETFTSSTCGPCAPANVTAEALFAQNLGKFTSIKYQADFPMPGDPYYTLEGGNRRSYYAINSVPRMEIDGGWDQNGGNITQQVLDDYINEVSFINLSANYLITSQTVDVDITIDPLEDIQSNNLVVHVAVIEETTYNNIKTNGETQFEHVVKKMLPNDNGTSIVSLIAGQQSTLNLNYTFNGNYRLPSDATNPINHAIEHSVEDFSNLMVVVWVQDVVTKEVHQSTYAILSSVTPISFNCINYICVDPGDGTGTYSSLAECQSDTACTPPSTIFELNNPNSINIFPNPVGDNIFVSNLEENTMIKIFDINGRVVLETKYSDKKLINTSFLSPGVYQIRFEGANWIETKKLIKE